MSRRLPGGQQLLLLTAARRHRPPLPPLPPPPLCYLMRRAFNNPNLSHLLFLTALFGTGGRPGRWRHAQWRCGAPARLSSCLRPETRCASCRWTSLTRGRCAVQCGVLQCAGAVLSDAVCCVLSVIPM